MPTIAGNRHPRLNSVIGGGRCISFPDPAYTLEDLPSSECCRIVTSPESFGKEKVRRDVGLIYCEEEPDYAVSVDREATES